MDEKHGKYIYKTLEIKSSEKDIRTVEDIEQALNESSNEILAQIEQAKKGGWVVDEILSHQLHITPLDEAKTKLRSKIKEKRDSRAKKRN